MLITEICRGGSGSGAAVKHTGFSVDGIQHNAALTQSGDGMAVVVIGGTISDLCVEIVSGYRISKVMPTINHGHCVAGTGDVNINRACTTNVVT